MVSESQIKNIRVWDTIDNYALIKTLKDADSPIKCITQLADGMLVSGSEGFDKNIRDPINNYDLIKNVIGYKGEVNVLLQLSNGMLLSRNSDKTIKLLEIEF